MKNKIRIWSWRIRTALSQPFIFISWVFYKIHLATNPNSDWVLQTFDEMMEINLSQGCIRCCDCEECS